MKTKTIAILTGWAFIISSIILQSLYISPLLLWFHYILLFITSLLCGMIIVDLKDIILGYFFVIPISLLTMIFCLAVLPEITGKILLTSLSLDMLIQSAVIIILRSTFPSVWILCLIAAILGAALGEKLKINAFA
jgi:hypothetical protein